ncbi:TatD family hydrolase [Wenzhouxiangella sp. XN24]|uniref:TatD family hydrolase n=1 Tax=Wenzhouxiangella sp. XN24 TaxID=2713569 RepID=UPI0013EA300D|nr:TatD family hydrolase [Wenzhouxiangella sp. XN24]NGX16622.1 hydrolase TatD [Wenzhouxiangella sp. XN24]
MTLVDIGVNLAHDSFDGDRDAVIGRAREAGVARMIITGSSLASSAAALRLARQDPGLFATIGVHPHHATELGEHEVHELEALLADEKAVAVGECGLDFFRDFSPRDRQEAAFRLQLELAMRTGLPVFLHQRDAHERFVALLDECGTRLPAGVAHCFTGGPAELEDYLERGLYIGVTGWVCDERRGDALRAAVRHLPLDRVMIETDAPYLLPRDLQPRPRTRRNEPVHLPHVLQVLAGLMDVSPQELAAASTRNAEALFGL